ncbi:uncharacterized protein LOC119114487, partial [Pollicipes pollicipes]|uniref:uncharacterized protein LOC119114487 n=1 Tax=Pollicipes pollicipes TaxID=41117 RepID=UPI001884DD6C
MNVTVEEFGTGLSQSEMRPVHRDISRTVSASVPENAQLFIKPGLPYYGRRDHDTEAKDNGTGQRDHDTEARDDGAGQRERDTGARDDGTGQREHDTEHSELVQTEFGYTPLIWETEPPQRLSMAIQCRDFITDSQGSVVYFIPPQAPLVDSVDVRLTGRHGGRALSRELVAFVSPSNSYLTIDPHLLPDELPCRGDVTVQLLTSLETDVPPMVYQVMTRGQILQSGQVSISNLTLSVTPNMSPQFKLLVFLRAGLGRG